MAVIIRGDGNDRITGTPQSDTILAGGGNDTINSLASGDNVFGGNGNDFINSSAGSDRVFGDAGNDNIFAGDGNDNVLAGAGNDTVRGEGGNDRLLGDAGADVILAGPGNDIVIGGLGNDALVGGVGNDTLIGSVGNDTLVGNVGNDSFAFFGRNEGVDIITDFSAANDTILVSTDFGGGLKTGAISANQLQFGNSARDGNDRFIYDTTTGALYFDADGNGGAKQIQIATLGGAPSISNADIVIFNENQLGISQSTSISVDGESSRSSSSQVSFG